MQSAWNLSAALIDTVDFCVTASQQQLTSLLCLLQLPHMTHTSTALLPRHWIDGAPRTSGTRPWGVLSNWMPYVCDCSFTDSNSGRSWEEALVIVGSGLIVFASFLHLFFMSPYMYAETNSQCTVNKQISVFKMLCMIWIAALHSCIPVQNTRTGTKKKKCRIWLHESTGVLLLPRCCMGIANLYHANVEPQSAYICKISHFPLVFCISILTLFMQISLMFFFF